MYKKPDGKIGVSFSHFINNAAPSFMLDSTKDPGHISMAQRDMFYSHQMSQPNPYPLNNDSLWQTGILDNAAISRKGLQALQKTGVCDHEGYVDTTKIGPKFTHDMAIISAVRQKMIIDFLFWWEEETQRLRKLQDEKAELQGLIESTREDAAQPGMDEGSRQARVDQLTLLLNRVNLKIGQKPSERRQDMERDEDELMVRARAGSDGGAPSTQHAGSAAAAAVAAAGTAREQLPAYHA